MQKLKILAFIILISISFPVQAEEENSDMRNIASALALIMVELKRTGEEFKTILEEEIENAEEIDEGDL